MKQNLIIRASAGTGKTFALATRFIRLMLLQGANPDRIVALTFSRAAAQEIYMKLLERLWKAAMTEQGAQAEREILLQGLSDEDRSAADGAVKDWSARRFAEILRRVIATQHHGTIATLDSFILKIVRSFPLEMGFQNAVDVLDGFGEQQAVAEARREVLAGADVGGEFSRAFKTATRGEFVRTCSSALGRSLEGWRDFLLKTPACAAWTPASMRAVLGIAENPVRPDVSILPEIGKRGDPLSAIVKALAEFNPDGNVFPANKGGELMQHLAANPEATSYTYLTDKGKKEKTITCTPDQADVIRRVVRYMMEVKVGHALETVAAKLKLCRIIEGLYDESTRRRGLLTFADFTDCQALAERDEEGALKIENLQFRFDSRFDHWALDEFQDTSELQWTCLRRLVHEAAHPDAGRSVMAVGDLKQSIYAWRGGNDGPFKEMMNRWPEFRGDVGEIVPNAVSYRYEKNTADFINRVFGPENVRDGGVLTEENAAAVERWLAEDCWMEHRPAARDGVPLAGDYVEVVAVPAVAMDAEQDAAGAAMRVLAPGIGACVAALWKSHEDAKSTDTIGILVRNNNDGQALAERLRARNLPVVWEGVDGVLDSPIVRAVLELLKLAEHPEDEFAWRTVNELFPIRELVCPDVAYASTISKYMAEMLSRLGLARTLKEVVAKITASASRPDARSVLRLEALVREGVNYERRGDAAGGVLDFIDYLAASSGRETSSSPHVIRILTIHRSKGLTLDHVIVPVLETGKTDTIVKPRRGTPMHGEGWALDPLPEAEAKILAPVAQAWWTAANERVLEQLRLNYVALTRARKSTHVFVCDDDHAGTVQFRDLLCAPFKDDKPTRACAYGRLVCELGTMPAFGRRGEATAAVAPWQHAAGRERVLRRSPSSAGIDGHGPRPAPGGMFAPGPSASEKGTAAHARYAGIEWIDAAAPADDFERHLAASAWAEAFVRPPDAVAVWRERSYEFYGDGVWETGQFDRVVLTGTGAARAATIYDFKTNARRPGEDEGAFARRMAATYAAQMAAYRRALAKLTGISDDRISAKLLLESTRGVVDVGNAKLPA